MDNPAFQYLLKYKFVLNKILKSVGRSRGASARPPARPRSVAPCSGCYCMTVGKLCKSETNTACFNPDGRGFCPSGSSLATTSRIGNDYREELGKEVTNPDSSPCAVIIDANPEQGIRTNGFPR